MDFDDEEVRDPSTLTVVRPEEGGTSTAPPPAKIQRRQGKSTKDVAQARRLDKMRADRLARRQKHEQAVEHMERKLRSELEARVQAHPLFGFANLVNGGLGKSTKVRDVTMIMDTTQAQAYIASLIADLRMAYEMREHIEIEQEERLGSGKAEHLASYNMTRLGLKEVMISLSAHKRIMSSSAYLSLVELVQNGVRDNVIRRRWDAATIAATFRDAILPAPKDTGSVNDLEAILSGSTASDETLLSAFLGDQQNTATLLVPYDNIRKKLVRRKNDMVSEGLLNLTLHALNLLDPLITSRLYGAREPTKPLVNFQLLFSAVIFPAISAGLPTGDNTDIVLWRLKYILVHMWMEATNDGSEYSRALVETLFPTLKDADLSESEADSFAEPAPSDGEVTTEQFLAELAKFFVLEHVYEHQAFWPASLLRIIYAACGPHEHQKQRMETNYSIICPAIVAALQTYFGKTTTLGTLTNLTESDHDFSRDLYNLDALVSILTLSAQWLDRGNPHSTLGARAQSLANTNGWRTYSAALHLRDAFRKEGDDLIKAINNEESILSVVKERVLLNEAKRLETFENELAKARGAVATQVLEVLDVSPTEHTLSEGIDLEVARLTADLNAPSVLRAIMDSVASGSRETEHESDDDFLAGISLSPGVATLPRYHQPRLYPACADLKERFDTEHRHLETETNTLAQRESQLRLEGEAQGWLAPDGSEREPTVLRMEREEKELKASIDDMVAISTGDLQRSIQRNMTALATGSGIKLRSDMDISSKSIFAEITQSSRGLAAVIRDAYFLQTARSPEIMAAFADAVSADINRNEMMSGSRGNYIQNEVYRMNTKRRYMSMESLIKQDMSQL